MPQLFARLACLALEEESRRGPAGIMIARQQLRRDSVISFWQCVPGEPCGTLPYSAEKAATSVSGWRIVPSGEDEKLQGSRT